MRLHYLAGLCMMAWCRPGLAQQVTEQSVPANPAVSVVLDIKYASRIDVKTWDKNEVYLKTLANINDGKDNDALQVKINQEKEQVDIRADIPDINQVADRYVAANRKDGVMGGDQYGWLDLVFQVYVPAKTQLTIRTLTGDVYVLHNGEDLSINSITGNVDVSVAHAFSAHLKIKTETGDVFTDMDLPKVGEAGSQQQSEGYEYEGKLNGGNASVAVLTNSGNIYLRKISK